MQCRKEKMAEENLTSFTLFEPASVPSLFQKAELFESSSHHGTPEVISQ
jgi:hypothetical protein